MRLGTSREGYLGVTYVLKNNKGTARSIDIAQYMGISKPSVYIAVKRLEEQGYIKKDPAGLIELTNSGKVEAELVFEIHCFLEQVLMDVGISREQTRIDARRLEHAISEESSEALEKAGSLHELEQDK